MLLKIHPCFMIIRCSSSPSLFLRFFKRFGVLFLFGRSSLSSSSSKFASSSTVASTMFLLLSSFSLSSTLSELEDKDYLLAESMILQTLLFSTWQPDDHHCLHHRLLPPGHPSYWVFKGHSKRELHFERSPEVEFCSPDDGWHRAFDDQRSFR